MPLSKIQTDILRLLAAHRDPESYVARNTPLNRDAPQYSRDIDVFHDREERVAQAAEQDSTVLQQHGYALQWLRRESTFYAVLAQHDGETTKLEWVLDSDCRFFRRYGMKPLAISSIRLTLPSTKSWPPRGGGSRATWWIC